MWPKCAGPACLRNRVRAEPAYPGTFRCDRGVGRQLAAACLEERALSYVRYPMETFWVSRRHDHHA